MNTECPSCSQDSTVSPVGFNVSGLLLALASTEILFTVAKSLALPMSFKRLAVAALVIESVSGMATLGIFCWVAITATAKCDFSKPFTILVIVILLVTESCSIAVESVQMRSKILYQEVSDIVDRRRLLLLQGFVFVLVTGYLTFWTALFAAVSWGKLESGVGSMSIWQKAAEIFYFEGDLSLLVLFGILLGQIFLQVFVRVVFRKHFRLRVSYCILVALVDLLLAALVLLHLPKNYKEEFCDEDIDSGECCNFLRVDEIAFFSSLLSGYTPAEVVVIGALGVASGVTALSAYGVPTYSQQKEITDEQAMLLETSISITGPVAVVFTMQAEAAFLGAVALAVVLPQVFAIVAPHLGEYAVATFKAIRSMLHARRAGARE